MVGFSVALSPLTLPTNTSLPPRSSLSVSSASVLLSTPLTFTCEYYFGTYIGREAKSYRRDESDAAGGRGEEGRSP